MTHILIAEDDGLLQKVMRTKFEKAGYRVSIAGDGEEALAKMRAEKPALVLLDIRMPKKNGFEVLKEAKRDPAIADIPVLILSNLSQDPDIEKGLELGAADYIVKSDLSISDVVKKAGEYVRE